MAKKRYKKRPIAERQAYHFEQSQKGALGVNNKTGEVFELSDFARGVHMGKAQSLLKKRKNYAIYNQQKQYAKRKQDLETAFAVYQEPVKKPIKKKAK